MREFLVIPNRWHPYDVAGSHYHWFVLMTFIFEPVIALNLKFELVFEFVKMPMCIVCGCSDSEVKKLFCFPQRPERSDKWLKSMGLAPQGRMSTCYKICDKHFAEESFVKKTCPLRLKRDAMPTIRAFRHTIESLPGSSGCSTSESSNKNLNPDILPQFPSELCRPVEVSPAEVSRASPHTVDTLPGSSGCSTSEPTKKLLNPDILPQFSSELCRPLEDSPAADDVSLPNSVFEASSSNKATLQQFPLEHTVVQQLSTADVSQPTPTYETSSSNVCYHQSKESFMRKTLKNKIHQLKRLQKECRKRGSTIANLLSDSSMEVQINNMLSHLTPTSATFIAGQIRCGKVSPHGRRWTIDEKVLALSLLKRSPRAYSLLRKLTSLPSKNTLNRLLQKIPFEAGVNVHILRHLSQCLQKLAESDRHCTLAFDEMSIREHVEYNSAKDRIDGVEDLGGGVRTEQVAKFAIVFLAQGINGTWKQPIAYFLTRNGVSSNTLERILTDVLRAMFEVSIPVIATVCDMGTSNVRALQNMGSTIENPCIMVDGNKIFTLFDVPHLLKCTRNLFHKHNVSLPCTSVGETQQMLEARWTDVVNAYEADKKGLQFRLVPRVKDDFLMPKGGRAMKVVVAARIMSRSMACCIFQSVQSGKLPSRAVATAQFIYDVDEMFDSLNGTSKIPPEVKPYRCMVTEESGHLKFWDESFKKVLNWRYIRSWKDLNNCNPWKPPSQRGWLHTLNPMKEIANKLTSIGITCLKPRFFNQDALENLFGGIRSSCGCNENPTVPQFVAALKTQIVNRLSTQNFESTNCEADAFEYLTDLRCFLQIEAEDVENVTADNSVPMPPNIDMPLPSIDNIENAVAAGSFECLSVAYVAGFIISRIFKDWSCDVCSTNLRSDDLEPFNTFITLKDTGSEEKKLNYPSAQFVTFLGCGISQLESMLPTLRKYVDIEKRAVENLKSALNFNFLTCDFHKEILKNKLLVSICRIGIKWYCTRVARDIQTTNRATNRKKNKILHV